MMKNTENKETKKRRKINFYLLYTYEVGRTCGPWALAWERHDKEELEMITCSLEPLHNRVKRRIGPIHISWHFSDKIGDITRTSGGNFLITEKVRKVFEANNVTGVEYGPVIMHDPPEKYIKRVKLPWEGEPIYELIIKSRCSLKLKSCGAKIEAICKECNYIEERPYSLLKKIILDLETWDGGDIFRLNEYPGHVVITEKVANLIKENAFTNVKCLPIKGLKESDLYPHLHDERKEKPIPIKQSKFYYLYRPFKEQWAEPREVVYENNIELIRCSVDPEHPIIWRRRSEEVHIAWYSCSKVPDFSYDFWHGYKVWFVKERVKKIFEENNVTGVKYGPVVIHDPPEGDKKYIKLPWEEEPIYHLIITAEAHLDLKASGVEVVSRCEGCDKTDYSYSAGKKIVIDLETWDGSDIFRLKEVDCVVVTEKVRRLIEENKFTNIRLAALEEFETPRWKQINSEEEELNDEK